MAVRKKSRVVTKTAVKKPPARKKGGGASLKSDFDITLEKITHYIQERAYYIWEEMGKPAGKDWEIWMKAEKDILSRLIKK